MWDARRGEPIHRAIVWQCRRTAEMCDALKADGAEPLVRGSTGLVLDAYFSGTKMGWLLDHVPGARARAERGELAFGTVDTWLLWKLTGGRVHATEPTNASRTLCFDICATRGRGTPSCSRCSAFRREVLPACALGRARSRRRAASGSPARHPDRGHRRRPAGRALRPGLLRAGHGQEHLRHRLLLCSTPARAPVAPATGCSRPWPGGSATATTYALEGSVFIAGAAVQWLRDGLGMIAQADETPGARRVGARQRRRLFVPAFVGLGAPYWDATRAAPSRPHARHRPRAPRARRARGDRVPEPRRARRHGRRPGMPCRRCAWTAAPRERLPLPVPGRRARRPGGAPAVTETTALGAAYLAGARRRPLASAGRSGGPLAVDRPSPPRHVRRTRGPRPTRGGVAPSTAPARGPNPRHDFLMRHR